eukprot:TRINITY_DN6786_c0_g1_i1.p1 TRINITY_DN6786_c0_g1~~TRINITY_DN6786_c0_g1_i1.p1  ORF type:complete len:697 (+),score=355.79 TRINITY_DN6786_c0_g1_i1:81-2171(+)
MQFQNNNATPAAAAAGVPPMVHPMPNVQNMPTPAPAANQPHTIVVSAMNMNEELEIHEMPCDLTTLTMAQIYKFCQTQLNAVQDQFEVVHSTIVLPNDESMKAIDVGLSNKTHVSMHPKGGCGAMPPQQQPASVDAFHMPPQPGMNMNGMPSMNPGAQMMGGMPQMSGMMGMMPSPQMMPGVMPHMQHMPSPQMVPNLMPTMHNTSPPLNPSLSPLGAMPMQDPAFMDGPYDINSAIGYNIANQMQISAALGLTMGGSPVHTPAQPQHPAMPPNAAPLPVPATGGRPSAHYPVSPVGTSPTGSSQPRTHRPSNASNGGVHDMTNEGARQAIAAIESAEDPKKVSQKLVELAPKFGVIASNQHGSKVIRALIRAADKDQMSHMIKMACAFIVELCESNTGSDVFVELIQKGNDDDANPVVAAILGSGPPLCKIINGKKVLQAALQKFSADHVAPIFDMVEQNLRHLATDQTGCVTIQRCLDHAPSPTLKQQLQSHILSNTKHLITDMYGNYVLQHAIKGDQAAAQALVNEFKSHVASLAVNKYSSCVIEKCFDIVSEEMKEMIIAEVLTDLKKLMWDGYGNFVVQSAVDHAPAAMLPALKEAILPFISDCPYGYRIEGKLNKRLKKGRKSTGRDGRTGSLSPEQQLLQMMMKCNVNAQNQREAQDISVAQGSTPQQLLEMLRVGGGGVQTLNKVVAP